MLVHKFLQSRDPQQVTLFLHIQEIADIFIVSLGNFDIRHWQYSFDHSPHYVYSEVKWNEVSYSEVLWDKSAMYIKVTLYCRYLIILWLFHLGISCAVYVLTCTVVVLTCCVMCGCFGNMCTCIYCVLYCLYCVYCIVSFMCIYSYLFC